jgi:hypothetical protein
MKLYYFILLTAVMFSCKVQDLPAPGYDPQMRYTDLQNAEMKHSQPYFLDIDGDGSTDFSFSTMLVGDPILQRDRLQFIAHSKIGTNLLNNDNDQSPVLNNGDKISVPYPGYEWFELSAIVLAEKITGMTEPMHWAGLWRNAVHRYLPVQLKKNGKFYNGWVELSFDSLSEKLILHKTAISIEAGKEIKAGY